MNNFIMLSPQYPPRLRFFAGRLKARGFNVLGVGDADFGCLDEALRCDLAEYCRADLACYSGNEEIDKEKYSPVLSTARYLADKYGPPSCLESFNEWWLPLDKVCCYAARVFDRPYLLPHEELLARFGGEIVLHMPMDSKVMGDYAYLVLTETQERRAEILAAISELRG